MKTRMAAALALLTLASSCADDADIFPSGTYLMRGRRVVYQYPNPVQPAYSTVTALPDLQLTIERVSATTIRVNGLEGVAEAGSNDFVLPAGPSGLRVSERSTLTFYPAGDSVVLKEFSHVGHSSTTTDTYSGRRPQ